MSFQKTFIAKILVLSLLTLVLSSVAFSQVNGQPTTITQATHAPKAVAVGNNLYCAGYIQTSAISTGNKIIAGQMESDKYQYAQGDLLYINMGHDKGVNVGDTFAVVRPRGAVDSHWSHKGYLGFYVQEVGALEVVKVKATVSAVRVKSSCDIFFLGDLVQLVEQRYSPLSMQLPPLDVFGDWSGKATGRILMSRDGAELLTRDFIVYVDLGAEDNVRIGDHLTVFRPIEGGNITLNNQRESVSSRDYGFQSDHYRGGKFSNQSTRKTGDKANGREVTTKMSRQDRPDDMRKVVGEAVVLNVKERTATVVITRTAQEIHPGDWVELQ